MFINFLINFLHLENGDAAYYLPWYTGVGQIIGSIVPFVCSLLFVFVFYYLWSRVKAVNTFHWCMTGFVNIIVTYVVCLLIGRASLANFISGLGDEYLDLWFRVTTWPFTTDVWIFALNGVIWAIVFYFILSVLLKRWSPVWNIPFGKRYKKAIN